MYTPERGSATIWLALHSGRAAQGPNKGEATFSYEAWVQGYYVTCCLTLWHGHSECGMANCNQPFFNNYTFITCNHCYIAFWTGPMRVVVDIVLYWACFTERVRRWTLSRTTDGTGLLLSRIAVLKSLDCLSSRCVSYLFRNRSLRLEFWYKTMSTIPGIQHVESALKQ